MRWQFRLLPVLIGVASLTLAYRVVDIWFDFGAHAQTAGTPPPAAPTPPAAPPGPVAPAAAAPAALTSAPSPEATPAVTPATGAPASGSRTAPTSATHQVSDAADPLSMSPQEIDVLQKLAQRRQELDKRAADISQQQVLLKAAEQRIDDKIAKLKSIETDIGSLAEKRDQQEDERLKSLVKIYETMKPADAARIFEQLDMSVLLEVMKRMKEAKVAPILAAMDSEKAKAATTALAERKRQDQSTPQSATP